MKYIPTRRIATHPGVILRRQIKELGLSVHGLARDLGLPATRLHEIVRERRGVSAETTIALGEYFGQTAMFWLNAQILHDLSRELVQRGKEIQARGLHSAEVSANGTTKA